MPLVLKPAKQEEVTSEMAKSKALIAVFSVSLLILPMVALVSSGTTTSATGDFKLVSFSSNKNRYDDRDDIRVTAVFKNSGRVQMYTATFELEDTYLNKVVDTKKRSGLVGSGDQETVSVTFRNPLLGWDSHQHRCTVKIEVHGEYLSKSVTFNIYD